MLTPKPFRRRLVAAITAVIAVGGLAMASPLSAQAGGGYKFCGSDGIVYPSLCGFAFTGFRGGTIEIELDESGSLTKVSNWYLYTNGVLRCSGQFRSIDPPKRWACYNVTGGNGEIIAQKRYGPNSMWVRVIY